MSWAGCFSGALEEEKRKSSCGVGKRRRDWKGSGHGLRPCITRLWEQQLPGCVCTRCGRHIAAGDAAAPKRAAKLEREGELWVGQE